MDKELFDDLITACNQAIEHEKGNIKLKSRVVEVPDEEIITINKFNSLSDRNKRIASVLINELYQEGAAAV